MKHWLYAINIFGILFLLMFGPNTVLANPTSASSCQRAFSVKSVIVVVINKVRSSFSGINAKENGETTLLRVLESDHWTAEDVKELLNRGADPNIASSMPGGWNVTPLIRVTNISRTSTTSAKDRLSAVQMLLDKGANPNAYGQMGKTALIYASKNGHLEIVRALLDKDANPNFKDKNDETPLIHASKNGHLEIVRALLDKGADVQVISDYGSTALMHASKNGHLEIVRALLDKGTDVQTISKENPKQYLDQGALNALHNLDYLVAPLLLTSKYGHLEIVRALLDAGANFDAKSNEGSTALMVASANGHLKIVRVLLDKGANFDAKNNEGMTALIWASSSGYLEVVRALLDKGANFDAKDNLGGATALMHASEGGHIEVVRVLLSAGADPNSQQLKHNSWTALMLASSNGHLEIVRALLSAGADPKITDNKGQTAKDIFMGENPTIGEKFEIDRLLASASS